MQVYKIYIISGPRYITVTAGIALQKWLTQKQQKIYYEYILYFFISSHLYLFEFVTILYFKNRCVFQGHFQGYLRGPAPWPPISSTHVSHVVLVLLLLQ